MAAVENIARRASTGGKPKLSHNLEQQGRQLLNLPLAKNIFSQQALASVTRLLTEPTVKLLRNLLSNRKSGHQLNITTLNLHEENQLAVDSLKKVSQRLGEVTNETYTVTFTKTSGYQIMLAGEERDTQALPTTQEESAARQNQLGIETPPPSAARGFIIEGLKAGLAFATWMSPEDFPLELALSPGAISALKICLGVQVPKLGSWLLRQFVVFDASTEPTANLEPATT